MITCDDCGKVNGTGQVGSHWICDDCKEGSKFAPESDESLRETLLTGLILADDHMQSVDSNSKLLMPLAGITVIRNQILEMKKICKEIIVVAQEPSVLYPFLDIDIRIITSYFPEKGVVGSMHAGFSLARFSDIWVVGSNMSYPSAEVAKLQLQQKENEFDAVIPTSDDVVFPFHGIYDKRCAAKANALLTNGNYHIQAFLHQLHWLPFHTNMDQWGANEGIRGIKFEKSV